MVALDILHKLIAEDEVVLVKMNPVNDYLGPLLTRAFAPLVDRGVLRFAYGGPEVGKYLVEHPAVDTIHLTGSEATYNSIVWGSPTVPVSWGGKGKRRGGGGEGEGRGKELGSCIRRMGGSGRLRSALLSLRRALFEGLVLQCMVCGRLNLTCIRPEASPPAPSPSPTLYLPS